MKKYSFTTIAFLSLLLWSCQSGSNSNAAADGESYTPPNNTVEVPASLAFLFAPNEGVLRGHDFSSTKEQIKGSESAELLEDNDNSIMYSLDLNTTDFADITYEFGGTDLDKIIVDIYTENLEAASQYEKMLEDFFNQKYQEQADLWDGSEDGLLFTANVVNLNEEESPGLVIFYEEIKQQ